MIIKHSKNVERCAWLGELDSAEESDEILMSLISIKKFFMSKRKKNSAHADGGPRSRVCARRTLRSAPHRRERKFFGARVCSVAGGGGGVKFSNKNSDQLSRQIRQF